MVVLEQATIDCELENDRFFFSIEAKRIKKLPVKDIICGEKIILEITDEIVIGDFIVIQNQDCFEVLAVDESHINMVLNVVGRILFFEIKLEEL